MDDNALNEYIALMDADVKQVFVDLTALASVEELQSMAYVFKSKFCKERVMASVHIGEFDMRNMERVQSVPPTSPAKGKK